MDMSLLDRDVETLPLEEAERSLRVQLAAAYRMVDHFGWTELIYGHLTVRVPGPDIHFLINPYGLNYDEINASNLVKIDLDGNIIGHSDYPVNKAGFIIHSAVHMANAPENKCVMHTHTRAGMAIAATQEGVLPVSMTATGFYGRLSYHEFEGPSFDLDERPRLLEHLGQNKAMILKNHGLLTVGKSVADAFLRLYRLERACQVQLDAAAAGTLNIISHNLAMSSGQGMDEFSGYGDASQIGMTEFKALMRKLDKVDPSYRD